VHHFSNIKRNLIIPWNPELNEPVFDPVPYIYYQDSAIESASTSARVMVSPMVFVRSDKRLPVFIRNDSNVQNRNDSHF
jgi:carbonic anhydrase/acetyltransferase-like protein (isoleucine patch superfamily)